MVVVAALGVVISRNAQHLAYFLGAFPFDEVGRYRDGGIVLIVVAADVVFQHFGYLIAVGLASTDDRQYTALQGPLQHLRRYQITTSILLYIVVEYIVMHSSLLVNKKLLIIHKK